MLTLGSAAEAPDGPRLGRPLAQLLSPGRTARRQSEGEAGGPSLPALSDSPEALGPRTPAPGPQGDQAVRSPCSCSGTQGQAGTPGRTGC